MHHLITGATGFVGGAITLELLSSTNADLTVLVRADKNTDPRRRVHERLDSMAVGYDLHDVRAEIQKRIRVVVGDITHEDITSDLIGPVDQLWHCAASLRYKEKDRDEIELHNVCGTKNVLALARMLDVPVFNYISTAYVAGSMTGEIFERPVESCELANNAYESSKIRSEWLVEQEREKRNIRILRPSIVIGHSRTLYAVNHSGIYGFARRLLRFREQSVESLGYFLEHTRLHLLAEPEIPLNLVPIDMVARNAVAISLSNSNEIYFHLANATPPTVGDAVVELMRLLRYRLPRWVDGSSDLTSVDYTLNAGVDFYGSYLRNGKNFLTEHTQAAIGELSVDFPMNSSSIREYFWSYLTAQPFFNTLRLSPNRTIHTIS